MLKEEVSLNLAHLWYIYDDLDGIVPDYSNISTSRERYGLVVFQELIEHIVELYQEPGWVWVEELNYDSTKIKRMPISRVCSLEKRLKLNNIMINY